VIDISQVSDQELMISISAEDLTAWSELVKRYGKLVYSIAYQILKNNSDAEDAVQDTFISLKIYANRFDETQQLIPWLSRVAANQAIKIYKKKRNFNKKESIRMEAHKDSSDSHSKDAAEIMEKKEVELMVKKAIDLLPETSRVALTLYYAGGMNQTDIAKELGLSQFSISEKINMGLEKVKSYLKKAGVHASIVISPQLIKESLVSTQPPSELLLKFTSQFPSKSQVAQAASESVKVGGVAAKSKSYWLIAQLILGVTVCSLTGYFYWVSKSDQKTINKISNKFKPVDYADFIPFDYAVVEKGKGGALSKSEKVNWEIKNISNVQKAIVRKSAVNGAYDGLYLKNFLKNACEFRGTIKTYSEKCNFYFGISTPELRHAVNEVLNQDIFISSSYAGQTLLIHPIVNSEYTFKLFIWPEDNKWKAICLIYSDGKRLKEQDYFSWLEFKNKELVLGFFTDGMVECKNFEYRDLDSHLSLFEDPDIKDIENLLPKDFLPKSNTK
jgi:RNA polymerase sigma-70 factor (ECF subfamily)